jgi:hypothetical protein
VVKGGVQEATGKYELRTVEPGVDHEYLHDAPKEVGEPHTQDAARRQVQQILVIERLDQCCIIHAESVE